MARKIENIQDSFEIRLHGIQLMSSSFAERPAGGFGTTVNFNFNINVDNRIDVAKKIIVSFVKVEIMEVGKEYILASISTAVGIEIINFDKVIGTSENGPTVPPQLDGLIRTISISTARGVIFSELRGTYLHGAMLPIVFNPMPGETNKIQKG